MKGVPNSTICDYSQIEKKYDRFNGVYCNIDMTDLLLIGTNSYRISEAEKEAKKIYDIIADIDFDYQKLDISFVEINIYITTENQSNVVYTRLDGLSYYHDDTNQESV